MAVIDIPRRNGVHFGAIKPGKEEEHWLNPNAYPNQLAAAAYIDDKCPVEGRQEPLPFKHRSISLVVRHEVTIEGLRYVTRSIADPQERLFQEYDGERPRVSSLLEPLNAEEFGLRPGFYGEIHFTPTRGREIDPAHSHLLGTAYNELFVPLGHIAVDLGIYKA